MSRQFRRNESSWNVRSQGMKVTRERLLTKVQRNERGVSVIRTCLYGEHVWCQVGTLSIGAYYRSTNTAVVGQDNDNRLLETLHEVSDKHAY